MSDIGGRKPCPGCDDISIGHVENILVNILSKLPAKQVARCKLVSKLWNDLITGQNFLKLHFSCSRMNPKLIAYDHGHWPHPVLPAKLCVIEVTGRNAPFVTHPYTGVPFEIVCSFNGLVCSTGSGGRDYEIHICNPITRELLVLPDGSPSVSRPPVGIVSDPRNNKYKVLLFFWEDFDFPVENFKCEIYDPCTGVWTRLADAPPPLASWEYSVGPSHVNVGGRMYWFVWSDNYTVPKYILSVDMENNFTRLELPECAIDSVTFNVSTFLVGYGDRLLLITMEEDTNHCLYIWSLKSLHQSSWSYVRRVQHRLPKTYTKYVCSIASVKNEILSVVYHKHGGRIRHRMLNMDKMTWREIQFKKRFKSYYLFPFTESLFNCNLTD